MRKFLILLILILGLRGYAAPVQVAPNMYHDIRLITDDAIYNCFIYNNVEKAKLNGRVFSSEYNCIINKGGNVETGKSIFYYGNPDDYTGGTPYYFSRLRIFKTMVKYSD